jgi:hypothetical protein
MGIVRSIGSVVGLWVVPPLALADPEAKVREAINLISGQVPVGGRMLLQLAQSLGTSEDGLLRIMGQRIAYRT